MANSSGPGELIGSVVCTPSTPRVGESVLVEVKALDGRTYDPSDDVHVSINGTPGPRQWVQWAKPGPKALFVIASQSGISIERTLVKIQVSKPEKETDMFPFLRVLRRLNDPYRVEFHLEGMPLPRTTTQPRPDTQTQPEPGIRPRIETVTGDSAMIPKLKMRPKHQLTAKIVIDRPEGPPEFQWDFGDGEKVSSLRTLISHDFGRKLDRDRVRQSFDISMDFHRSDGTSGTVRRTIHFVNHYALAKQRGIIQPPVRSDLNAVFHRNQFRASLTVENVEDQAVHLTFRRIQPMLDDSSLPPLPKEAVNLEIPAKASRTVTVTVPVSKLPKEATGFAVHFGGTALGKPTRVSAYFDIPSRRKLKFVHISPEIEALLGHLVRHKLVSNPNVIDIHELEELAARDVLEMPSQGSPLWRLHGIRPRFKLGPITVKQASSVIEGAECDPDNLPDEVPQDFFCQATTETRWQPMPGRFLNARRGDIVLSPTGDTLIGSLLREVNPPQLHSHSGIMTRNYDQITHSTASEARLMAYPVGSIFGKPAPSDGHRPDVLKYLWPGVITQTVENAIHGEEFTDPDPFSFGKKYEIAGFDPNKMKVDMGVSEVLVFPFVVKPDPLTETSEIRQKLHQVADWALAQTGKGHYRFYCYTDPTIGATTPAPPSPSAWATGSLPTVCSSFIWLAVRQSGALMEGVDIEPQDVTLGAERAAGSQDGLYLYRAEERLAAGELMYYMLSQMVNEKLNDEGIFAEIGGWFADMADDVANQILNTFAIDWSDTEAKDSEAWRNTVDASAVSPDNLIFWDSPAAQGLYGFFEPLVYRPPRYEKVTVHRWRKVATRGTLTGTVLFDNQPVAQANLQIYDGKFTHSDGSGRFSLLDVPEGSYVLKASKVRDDGMYLSAELPDDGMYLSAELPVTIRGGETTDVTISLSLPDDMYRQAEIDINMSARDWEFGAAGYPWDSKNFFRILRVGPYDTHEETITNIVADDVHGRAIIKADWNLDKSITITLIGRMYEGSWDVDDLEIESLPKIFKVPAGGSGYWWHLRMGNNDYVDIYIKVKNVQQQA
jgi:hypothetical protein